jgi:UDP-glucuronate decarboxylase
MQTRSFCFVDDLLDGIVRAMEHPTESGPVNLGNPVEFTMLELAELVTELVGNAAGIVRMPLPTDDPKQRRPVIDKARGVLGFAPKVELREGLERTIADFRARL